MFKTIFPSVFFADVEEVQSETGETLEAQIGLCCALLSRPKLTDNDRRVVQKMLSSAQALK